MGHPKRWQRQWHEDEGAATNKQSELCLSSVVHPKEEAALAVLTIFLHSVLTIAHLAVEPRESESAQFVESSLAVVCVPCQRIY